MTVQRQLWGNVRMRRLRLCAMLPVMLSCVESRSVAKEGSPDAAVYSAITAAWRVRSAQFRNTPDSTYSAADSQLVALIRDDSASEASADIQRFGAGIGLPYDPDKAFLVPMVVRDSLYHPYPASLRNSHLQPRTLELSRVVYADSGQTALVYLSYSCCVMFAYESLLKLRNLPGRGWTVVRDEMRAIS